MLALIRQLLPRLRLLLILAAALGCFIFLFNFFGGLQSLGDTGLLDRVDPSATTIEVLNGAQLTAVLASFLCLALAVGSAWVCWQRLKGPNEKRLLTVLLSSLCAVGLFALGLYLGAVAVTQRGLPYGSLPYDHHRIDLTGVEPLGLALLAGFILSVAVVGIVRPRFVIVPVLVWLVLAFIFGMFESDAIRGLNLFDRLSRLQPVLAYQEIIDGYLPPVPGLAVAVPVETVPDPDAVEAFFLDLGSQDAESAENAAIALEELGAEVIGLETGGFLVKWEARVYLVPGITAKQTEPPESEPIFSVRGATENRLPAHCGRRTPTPVGFGPNSTHWNCPTWRVQMCVPWWLPSWPKAPPRLLLHLRSPNRLCCPTIGSRRNTPIVGRRSRFPRTRPAGLYRLDRCRFLSISTW